MILEIIQGVTKMTYTVKQVRMLSDKTQQEMANLLGIHVQTYRKIEKNPERTTFQQGQRISEATGISVDQIFFGR